MSSSTLESRSGGQMQPSTWLPRDWGPALPRLGWNPAVPSSLPPFWLVCALTLIVSHYQLWQRMNLAYRILGTLIVVLMPISAYFLQMLTRNVVLCLLAFEAVMVANMLTYRYLSPSALLSTASPPVVLLRALPLMLCGYTLAKYPGKEKRFLLFVGLVYWLFSIPDALGFIRGAKAGLGRAEQYAQTQGVDERAIGSAYAGAFVYFAPLMVFLAIALLRLYPRVSPPIRLVVMAAQLTLLAAALLSGFGAAVALVLAAVVLLGIFAPVRTIGYRLYWLAIAGGGLGVLEALRTFFLSSGGKGAVGSAFAKITLVLQSLFSFDASSRGLQAGSSGRVELFFRSMQTFASNPIVGAGQTGSLDMNIGGHSFFGDTAAVFGLAGLVPIVAFFALLVVGLRRARKTQGVSWSLASSTIFMGTLIIGLFMNPYLLNLLSLSYFLFLMLGFALADTEAAMKPMAPARPRVIS